MTWQLATGYVFFLVLALWFVFSIANYAMHRRFWRHRHYELLLVRVPLGGEVQPFAADHSVSEMGATAELFERLAAYQMPFAVEAAVPHAGEEIHFYLYIPRRHKKEIVREVGRLFPGARLAGEEYDLWTADSRLEAGYLRQAKPFLVPLSVAVEPEHDPFARVLRRLSYVKVLGEGAAIQWVIRPFAPSRRQECVQAIESLRTGSARSFRLIDEGFMATPQTIGVLERKLDSPLFSVNCRLLAAAGRQDEARRLLREIGEGFASPSSAALYNELYAVPAKKPGREIALFSHRAFNDKEEMVLNARELAAVFHFPTRHSRHPKVHRG